MWGCGTGSSDLGGVPFDASAAERVLRRYMLTLGAESADTLPVTTVRARPPTSERAFPEVRQDL